MVSLDRAEFNTEIRIAESRIGRILERKGLEMQRSYAPSRWRRRDFHCNAEHCREPSAAATCLGFSRVATTISELRSIFRYFALATTRVRSVPIAGDRISTTSPTFRNRSGAELRSGKSGLESAAVPAAVPPLMMSPG